MKNSRHISILLVVLAVLSLMLLQAVSLSAQPHPIGTGGLIGLSSIEQIVRLILGKAFVYTFGG